MPRPSSPAPRSSTTAGTPALALGAGCAEGGSWSEIPTQSRAPTARRVLADDRAPSAMASLAPRPTLAAPDDDPYLWLEEVDGERALAWVEAQNAATLG